MNRSVIGYGLIVTAGLLLYVNTQLANASGAPWWVEFLMLSSCLGAPVLAIAGIALAIVAHVHRAAAMSERRNTFLGLAIGAALIFCAVLIILNQPFANRVRAQGDIPPSVEGFIGFSLLYASPSLFAFGIAVIVTALSFKRSVTVGSSGEARPSSVDDGQ
jgi:hypothetical protein